MKPYSEYSAEELAMEKLFIRWVRFPDDPSIRAFWEGWIVSNPTMKHTVETARNLVLTASDWKPDSLSGGEVNTLWERIRNSLDMMSEGDQHNAAIGVMGNKKLLTGIILVIFATFLYFLFYFLL